MFQRSSDNASDISKLTLTAIKQIKEAKYDTNHRIDDRRVHNRTDVVPFTKKGRKGGISSCQNIFSVDDHSHGYLHLRFANKG
jgi:hypothetical protein